jgi:hypothetical protein
MYVLAPVGIRDDDSCIALVVPAPVDAAVQEVKDPKVQV